MNQKNTLKVDLNLLEKVFNALPDCPSFVKDKQHRYVAVNEAMVRFCGAKSRRDVIGKKAGDFFDADRATAYEAIESHIMKTGHAISDHFELSLLGGGKTRWILFSEFPIINSSGDAEGVIATATQMPSDGKKGRVLKRLKKILEHIQNNFADPLDLDFLSRLANTSKSQVGRDFKNLFNQSPQKYLNKVRMGHSIGLLEGETSVADIAYACGFADHSAFSRRFKETYGLSPIQYRKINS